GDQLPAQRVVLLCGPVAPVDVCRLEDACPMVDPLLQLLVAGRAAHRSLASNLSEDGCTDGRRCTKRPERVIALPASTCRPPSRGAAAWPARRRRGRR